jgi:lysozyme
MAFKTTNDGIEHLQDVEGLRLRAYDDAQPKVKIVSKAQIKGVLTIGYGHTKTVQVGQVISEAKAVSLMKTDIVYFENQVNKLVTAPITINMFNALVSFCYNVGEGAFKKSTPLRLTNQKKYEEAAKSFYLWDKPKGIEARREKEYDLYLRDYGVLKYELTKKKVNSNLFFDVIKLGFILSI